MSLVVHGRFDHKSELLLSLLQKPTIAKVPGTPNELKSWHNNKPSNCNKKLSEKKRLEAIEKKERRLENERRRQENEFRNAQQSAQTLNYGKVGSTLKAMSKKQLRQVKKTRMNTKTGVVEYVPAYSK